MTIQAWLVGSLAPVECYLPADLAAWTGFQHLGTNVRRDLTDGGFHAGDTVWGGMLGGQNIALAWDWLEIAPGIVTLLDPNRIVTNLRFLDEHDCYQEPLQAIISANRLTHCWPWQDAVVRAIPAPAHPTKVLPRPEHNPAAGRHALPQRGSGIEFRQAA